MNERLAQTVSFASSIRLVEPAVPPLLTVAQLIVCAWVTLCDWLTSLCDRLTSCDPPVVTSCDVVTCRDPVTACRVFRDWVTFCRITYRARAKAAFAAVSNPLQARMPSSQVWSNPVPHFLNQEPPTAQQLALPLLWKMPHVEHTPWTVFEVGSASRA